MDDLFKYMEEALAEAKKALAQGEIPIGCVIVKGEEIIASAYNQVETLKTPLAHAELLAIEEACKKTGDWRLTGCSLFTTLEPCIMCTGAILNARVEQVYYGACDKMGGGHQLTLFDNNYTNHLTAVTGGILEEQCKGIIQEFWQGKRRKGKDT